MVYGFDENKNKREIRFYFIKGFGDFTSEESQTQYIIFEADDEIGVDRYPTGAFLFMPTLMRLSGAKAYLNLTTRMIYTLNSVTTYMDYETVETELTFSSFGGVIANFDFVTPLSMYNSVTGATLILGRLRIGGSAIYLYRTDSSSNSVAFEISNLDVYIVLGEE